MGPVCQWNILLSLVFFSDGTTAGTTKVVGGLESAGRLHKGRAGAARKGGRGLAWRRGGRRSGPSGAGAARARATRSRAAVRRVWRREMGRPGAHEARDPARPTALELVMARRWSWGWPGAGDVGGRVLELGAAGGGGLPATSEVG
ncbi:hypothetical protein BRADI_3g46066v3 [Brachypodium distachyon]|uniref:Uncharacterized protein n=1 Tax=Brachypodium distachyon TaxID=15368 RepID=A0A0Q3FJW9_BRADI|nr:hypothetical protein BRADI_3g46066v3 [Brachypodium distachyon]